MPDSALPENLRGKRHSDWIWPLCYIPRGWTAFKFRMPPLTLLGYNLRNWDTAEPGDSHRAEYPYGRGLITWSKRLFTLGSMTYGANAIQKIQGTWKFSFHITCPLAVHFVIKLYQYKTPTIDEIRRGYDGVRMIYGRIGLRWDSYDAYYNLGFFIGGTFN